MGWRVLGYIYSLGGYTHKRYHDHTARSHDKAVLNVSKVVHVVSLLTLKVLNF